MDKASVVFLFILLAMPVAAEPHVELSENIQGMYNFSAIICGAKDVEITCLREEPWHLRWNDSCSIYWARADFRCANPHIVIDKDASSVVPIRVDNSEQALRKSIEQDAGADPLTVSKKVWGNILLGNKTRAEELLSILIAERDDEYKCWPKESCDLGTTVQVIKYLSRAGLNRTQRVYDNALTWVEANQNIPKYNDWKIAVDSRRNTNCSTNVSGSVLAFELLNETSYQRKFTYSGNMLLEATCEKQFCMDVIDEYNSSVYSQCMSADEVARFRISDACFGAAKWDSCNARITAIAAGIPGMQQSSKDAALRWLRASLRNDEHAGSRVSDDFLTNTYSYSLLKEDGLLKSTLYSQHNDGSFGDANYELETLTALEALGYASDAGVSAKKWLLGNRPPDGWEDIETDALYFDMMRRSRQQLISPSPMIITPGEFNITSDRTIGNATFIGELAMLQIVKFSNSTVTVKASQTDGIHSGYFSFSGGKVPVLYSSSPTLQVYFSEAYTVFDEQGTIQANVLSSASRKTCVFSGSDILNDTLVIEKSGNLSVHYKAPIGSSPVNASFVCETVAGVIAGNASFTIDRKKTRPFTTTISTVRIDGNSAQIRIENPSDKTLELRTSWHTPPIYYGLPQEIRVPPGEHRDFDLYQHTAVENASVEENVLTLEAQGYSQSIPLSISLRTSATSQPGFAHTFWFIGAGAACVLIIAYFLFRRRSVQISPAPAVRKTTEQQNLSIVEVLVATYKGSGKNDAEIVEELKKKGYDQASVDSVMKDLSRREV